MGVHLNGKQGVVQGFDEKHKRYCVLVNGKSPLLKEKNIRLVSRPLTQDFSVNERVLCLKNGANCTEYYAGTIVNKIVRYDVKWDDGHYDKARPASDIKPAVGSPERDFSVRERVLCISRADNKYYPVRIVKKTEMLRGNTVVELYDVEWKDAHNKKSVIMEARRASEIKPAHYTLEESKRLVDRLLRSTRTAAH